MGRILAVANQKGGVGKTTTCINTAASLAACDRRVLVIDLDPQGNATTGCGVDKDTLTVTTREVLMGEAQLNEAITHIERAGFDLLPANGDLTAAEVELMFAPLRERRLGMALENCTQYDYVFIDCPPSLNMLTVNALAAADGVFIPMQCEYFALEGLSALLGTVAKIREVLNADLRIEGLLRTMFDRRNRLSNEVSAQLDQHFGDTLYASVVPRNIRLAEAPSHGIPVLLYDRNSRGAQAYIDVAREMCQREPTPVPAETDVPPARTTTQ